MTYEKSVCNLKFSVSLILVPLFISQNTPSFAGSSPIPSKSFIGGTSRRCTAVARSSITPVSQSLRHTQSPVSLFHLRRRLISPLFRHRFLSLLVEARQRRRHFSLFFSSPLVQVIAHGIMALIFWYRANSVDLKSKDAFQSFYMFIFKAGYRHIDTAAQYGVQEDIC
ncbi:uncharacterized protein [Arachis hypogaea]|uniref:uncharacterized protein n=1 Tax=Arachis hypogaea TaxID=3818 RepID=UPI003B21BB2B